MALDCKLIPHLISLLINRTEELRIEATWCLTNIATGSLEQTRAVLEAMPYLIQILSSDVERASIKEQVCWTIGNLAGESDEIRSTLLANGCLGPLSRCLEGQDPSLARTSCWALSNLARGATPAEPFLCLLCPGTAGLLAGDERLAAEACWLLAFLSAKQAATEATGNLLPSLLLGVGPLLGHCTPQAPYGTPLVRLLGNLSSGPLDWLDLLLAEHSLVPALARLASGASAGCAVRKEALWALGNLLGGGPGHRDRVLGQCPAVLGVLLEALLDPCEPWGLKKEALRGLANASLEVRAAQQLAGQGPRLPACVVGLLRDRTDPQLCMDCVQLLRALALSCEQGLRDCVAAEGPEAIEELQYSPLDSLLGKAAEAALADIYARMEQQEVEEAPPGPSPGSGSGLGRGRQLLRPAWMPAEP